MSNNDSKMTWNFEPVETKRAYELVYEQIHEMILSGKLRPGDKLPSERSLMALFSRSHPTIREAMRMLERNGLIRVIPGGGSVVTEITSASLRDPFEQALKYNDTSLKELLEYVCSCEAKYLLSFCPKISCSDIEIQSSSSMPSLKDIFLEDYYFHRQIASIINNEIYKIMLSSVYHIYEERLFQQMSEENSTPFAVSYQKVNQLHKDILYALQQGDSLLLQQSLSQHQHQMMKLLQSPIFPQER